MGKKAELIVCPMENVEITYLGERGGVFNFRYKDKVYNNIEISLLGKHQIYNATLALLTMIVLRDKGLFEISNEQIRNHLNKTNGGEIGSIKRNPTFLIDGAHNSRSKNPSRKYKTI